jgi:hypothetical protein
MYFTICIIVRILIALCAKYVNDDILQKMGYILLVPSFFFIYLYLFDKRKRGIEVSNNIIWWNNLRPIHGCLMLLFSIYAIKKNRSSWLVLLFDVLLGILFYINNYV